MIPEMLIQKSSLSWWEHDKMGFM